MRFRQDIHFKTPQNKPIDLKTHSSRISPITFIKLISPYKNNLQIQVEVALKTNDRE